MVINQNIANWWFEDRRSLVVQYNKTDLTRLIDMCILAAEILKNYNLLIPTKVVFSAGWMRHNDDNNSLTRVEKSELTVNLPDNDNSKKIQQYCQEALDIEERQHGFLYPSSLEIQGEGIILDQDGNEKKFSNVTLIEGQTTDAHIVNIITHSYAWLPYTLKGEPQKEIYKYNAPRLEAALQEIENSLEVEAITDEASDFVLINNFKLDNMIDIDGKIIPIDDLGHFI